MVDTLYLEKKIKESGKKKQHLAEKIGCSRQYFSMKIKNVAEFDLKEASILCDELGITKMSERDRIFFAKNVTKSSDE